VDRNRQARIQQLEGARRSKGIEMVAGPGARTPSPDRHQRQVDAPGEIGHALEQCGVAGEVDHPRSLDQEPDRELGRPDWRPESAVLGIGRLDPQAADRRDVADAQLDHACEAAPAQAPAHAPRHDQPDIAGEQPQRAEVEVVPMRVGDEHGVDAGPRLGQEASHRTGQGARPRAEDRVRQQPDAIEGEHHRRVAQERQP
jgi:hypothetical protein